MNGCGQNGPGFEESKWLVQLGKQLDRPKV